MAGKGANQLGQDLDVEIDGSLHVLNLSKYGVCCDETDAVELGVELQTNGGSFAGAGRARNGNGQRRGRADAARTSELSAASCGHRPWRTTLGRETPDAGLGRRRCRGRHSPGSGRR
jgi:hypothetical protein